VPRRFTIIRHPRQAQTTLYLVRHGQTEGNAKHQFIGSTDLPLDPLGERQARRVGDRFASITLDTLIASPLRRAQQTAGEIARTTGRDLVTHEGVTEIDFGHLEGHTIEEVLAKHPDMSDVLAAVDETDIQWPGGESRSAFNRRVREAFMDIIARHEEQSVAVVCHGGVIGSFVAQIEGGSPNDFARYSFQNCSVTHLVINAEETLIHLANDYSHLDEVQTEPLRLNTRLMR